MTVGYYELNCQKQRENLRKLAANGMITYNAEQINEYDGTQLKSTHVFVNVALTAEGQKCVIEKEYVDSLSKDVDMLNRFASEKYPMDSVGKEIIPVRNPLYAEEGNPEEIKPIETPTITNCEKPAPTLYELALAKVQTKEVTVIAMKKTVAVVRNVICDELMLAQGNALKKIDVYVENGATAQKLDIGSSDNSIILTQEGEKLNAKMDRDSDGEFEEVIAVGKSTTPIKALDNPATFPWWIAAIIAGGTAAIVGIILLLKRIIGGGKNDKHDKK